MKFNLSTFSIKLARIGFYLLFPIFFVYHFCVSQSYFGPFLGGLFGSVSLFIAFISFSILPWFFRQKIKYVTFPVCFFYSAIIFYLSWTLGSQFLVQNHPYGYHAFWESYSSFIIWCAMFYIGFFLPVESLNFYNGLKLFCLLIVLITIFAIVKESSFFALFNFFQHNDQISSLSSYQQAGRSVLVSFLFFALIRQNKFFSLVILLICSIILLSIGSRTDLISSVLIVLLFCFNILIKGDSSSIRKVLIFLSFVVVIFFAFLISQSLFNDSRAAELFDLASSSSWQGRSDLSSNAILIINRNPIFGKFDYYDVAGGYAHNILSAWTSFGLFGFILYLVLHLYFLIVSAANYLFQNKLNVFWLLVFSFNLVSFFQAIIAAPIFYALPALGWGLTLNIWLKSRLNNILII